MKKIIAAISAVSMLSIMPAILPDNIASSPTFSVQAMNVVDNSQQITADGFGAMPAGMPLGRAKLMARRAAIVDAQRNLVETIKGTAVDSETSMENYIIQSDLVKTKVSGMVTGARVTSEEITSDGMYHVVMTVPMYGIGSVADAAVSAMVGTNTTPTPFPTPSTSYTPTATQTTTTTTTTTMAPPSTDSSTSSTLAPSAVTAINGGYTGLIIDARGNNMIRAFGPNIFDTNGRTIYSVHNVSEDYAIKYGIVSYAEGSDAWQKAESGQLSRVGSHPLIIKMAAPKARCVYNCDVIITPADADRILAENQKTHFLDKCAVTFEI